MVPNSSPLKEADKASLLDLGLRERRVPLSPLPPDQAPLPARAIAFISDGSLGLRCSFRLESEDDFPRLKKERQLPTGDFFILLGGLFLQQEK
ncbi:hypothetical protein E2320_007108, partial [Naja naja]